MPTEGSNYQVGYIHYHSNKHTSTPEIYDNTNTYLVTKIDNTTDMKKRKRSSPLSSTNKAKKRSRQDNRNNKPPPPQPLHQQRKQKVMLPPTAASKATSAATSSTKATYKLIKLQDGPKIGDIGFTFVKHFPGYGDFVGTVKEIRLGAEFGKTRRCVYTDGDEEDLSVKELEALHRSRKAKEVFHKRCGIIDILQPLNEENDDDDHTVNNDVQTKNDDVVIETNEDAIIYLENEAKKLQHTYIGQGVIEEGDEELLTDFCYHVMKRYYKIDQGREKESPTLVCSHCCSSKKPRIFAYSQISSVEKCFHIFGEHLMKCPETPNETKKALCILKKNHDQQIKERGSGARTKYILKLWEGKGSRRSFDKLPLNSTQKEALRYLKSANKVVQKQVGLNHIKKLAVEESDKELVTDYMYHVMKQYFQLKQGRSKRSPTDYMKGVPRIECGHCIDISKPRKFFFQDFDHLLFHISKFGEHLQLCRQCPKETKEALLVLKGYHEHQMKQVKRLGAQRKYVTKLWNRIVNDDGESRIVESDSEDYKDEDENTVEIQNSKTESKKKLAKVGHTIHNEEEKLNAVMSKIDDAINYLEQENLRKDNGTDDMALAVTNSDKELLSTYSYHVFNQYFKAHQTNPTSKWKLMLLCSHCISTPEPKRFNFSQLGTLTKNYRKLGDHLYVCSECPKKTKEALHLLRENHCSELKDQRTKKNRTFRKISHKQYFVNLWNAATHSPVLSMSDKSSDKNHQGITISIDINKSACKATIDVTNGCRNRGRGRLSGDEESLEQSSTAKMQNKETSLLHPNDFNTSRRSKSGSNDRVKNKQSKVLVTEDDKELVTPSESIDGSAPDQLSVTEVEHNTITPSDSNSFNKSKSRKNDKLTIEQSSQMETSEQLAVATIEDKKETANASSDFTCSEKGRPGRSSEEISFEPSMTGVEDASASTINQEKFESLSGQNPAALKDDMVSNNAYDSATQTLRKSSRQRRSKMTAENIGEIGYCFTKFFHSRGVLNGMVVEIIPGGKDDKDYEKNRCCVYTDGNEEILSLNDLKSLAVLYPSSVTSQLAERQDKEVKTNWIANKKKKEDKSVAISDGSQRAKPIPDWQDFDEIGLFKKASEMLPTVEVSMNTRRTAPENDKMHRFKAHDDDCSSDEEWLTSVAAGLLKSSKPSKMHKKSKRAAQGHEEKEEGLAYILLADVKQGERYGCKVVNSKLKESGEQIVGEVIVELERGWVEIVEGTEVRKGRVSDYIVVSSDNQVGSKFFIDVEKIQALSVTSETNSLSDMEIVTFNKMPPTNNHVDPNITLGDLFYWQCYECHDYVFYCNEHCASCNIARGYSPSSSLLSIAEAAVQNAKSLDEALERVDINQRDSIPSSILLACLEKKSDISPQVLAQSTVDVADYYYWFCGFCTVKNKFKFFTCKCCGNGKNELAESSVLLKIASQAAESAASVEEAMSKVLSIDVPAIPIGVMNTLVTCTATIARDNRRCRRPRVNGSDYCTVHIDTTFSTNVSTLKRKHNDTEIDSNRKGNEKRKKIFKSVADFTADVSNFFKHISPYVKNLLRWKIQFAEDAFCSERNSPFPLGLQVRRYFPGYGFHDGRIANIERKIVNENGTSLEVLVYRVEYNDGDREDLLHHEINSLRQIYNISAMRAIVPPRDQVPSGSLFETLLGVVEIVDIEATVANKSDNGKVKAKFCKKEENSWTLINLDLTKLQVTVVRKLTRDGEDKDSNIFLSPALEWPSCAPSAQEIEQSNFNREVVRNECGLDDKFVCSEPAMLISRTPYNFGIGKNMDYKFESLQFKSQFCCVRPGAHQFGWDPAGGIDYVNWDPFDQTKCEVCKNGDNARCILICDECNAGYHMYCLRPVISAIPTNEWLCPECSSEETGREGYEILVKDLTENFSQVSSFLSLPFQSPAEIEDRFREVVTFFTSTMPKAQRFAAFGYGKKKTLTTEIGGVHVNRRHCKHLWLLPIPELKPNESCHSFATMVAAFKYCGVSQYSEELVYADGVSEAMNDSSMDQIETMSKDNTSIFRLYKENLKNGIYPPVEVVYDDELGFTVRALKSLPRHTILTEYVGEVTTIEKSDERSSDSLMILLDTGDPKTSLIIDPTNVSNIARFLSGVNNRSLKSRRKANVRTRRFSIDGKSRVVLFTSRQIQAGESLNYDYNAGNMGKSVKDILRTGFYDTSNFL